MNIAALIIMVSTMALLTSCKEESKTEVNFYEKKEIVNEPVVVDEHTGMNSLDWEGTYAGNLPCSDCDGIYTEVTLKNNTTFILHSTKMNGDKKEKSSKEGSFQWDKTGSAISMEIDGITTNYKVGENQLILLDKEGNTMPASETVNYRLAKETEKDIK